MGKLAIVGVPATEEQVYRALLSSPGATSAELAAHTEVDLSRVHQAVTKLERSGLLSRIPDAPPRYVPAPPDVAVGALITQRQDVLEKARLAAEGMVAEFHRGTRYEHTSQVLEVITGRDAIAQRSAQLVRGAEHEVMLFDKPPYIGPQDNPDEVAVLARRVRWRAVYSSQSLAEPGQPTTIRRFGEAGEEARVSHRVPAKLLITDHRLALLPLTIDEPRPEETAILVHPSSMLTMLMMYFETVWDKAVPFARHLLGEPSRPEADDPNDRDLLSLLSAGVKDEAIARQLGVSLRTARRRISRIMADHGVTTRFQLGLATARELSVKRT